MRLDGADISQWDRDELGPYVGYLPQDLELFEGTVAENIARFGSVVPEQVVEAARNTGIHEMILRLPHGYDTQIGVRGGVLSAGQRQRLSLARAIYGKPVLVVLDEPNSNLDDEGELALARTIMMLKQHACSVLVITHRPRALARVDKVLLLRDGMIEAFGDKDDIARRYFNARQLPSRPATPAQSQARIGQG